MVKPGGVDDYYETGVPLTRGPLEFSSSDISDDVCVIALRVL
ncbi:hypothetical protein AB0G06_19415 [Nonomuraea dietziae]